jgi:predicted dehydrogenase
MSPIDLPSNLSRPLKVGVIGCGFFGEKRIQACLDIPQFIKITKICDVNHNLVEKLAGRYNLSFTSKPSEIYSDKSIDAVIISIPNKFHAEIAVDAMSHGKHVLCEKPLANTLKNAIKIEKAAIKYSRIVKTGSNHRFFPAVQKAYQLFISGEIGKVLLFKGSIGTNGCRTENSWFWNKNISGGGTFIDNGCHLLDISRMFMGDFVNCLGTFSSLYWKNANVEDYATALYQSKNGGQAIITSSWIQWSGYLYFELWGESGYIIVDNRGCARATVCRKCESFFPVTFDFSNQPIRSYHDELEYFAKCVNNHLETFPNATDGRKVLQMIEALYKSQKTKRLVKI